MLQTPPRVLIVDDEYKIVFTLKAILEKHGYEVHICLSGSEAIQLADAEHGRFDVVLLDYMMPVLRGDEVAAELKSRYPGLPIIFVSAFDIPEESRKLADGFFVKPETPAFVVQKVRETIARNALGKEAPDPPPAPPKTQTS